MLFNSLPFLIFFLVFFILYWGLNNFKLRWQNIFLLTSSYLFYGWWDYRFLFLIIASTIVDYFCGLEISKSKSKKLKRNWLAFSLIFNLGLLGYFKYSNFFLESLFNALNSLGLSYESFRLDIILPVGISFYTFQTLSYSIDIYRNKLSPTKNFIDFAAFVSFFPQLVAGPIERASHLLPQITKRRTFTFENGKEGLKLMLFGLFKKVVIADSLAPVVDRIFNDYNTLSGMDATLGVIFFSAQIYCDFSGYSDIAIGVALMLGIKLMTNFNFPYFSKNITEFWQRWHISLSTWFRDYLYIPLGGSRTGMLNAIKNVFIVFVISGFWHGANWTFIFWGFLHALFYVPYFISRRKSFSINASFGIPNNYKIIESFTSGLITYTLVCFAWIFFRANDLDHAFDYISNLGISLDISVLPPIRYLFYLILLDLYLKNRCFIEARVVRMKVYRFSIYTVLVLLIVSHTTKEGSQFIYFQF